MSSPHRNKSVKYRRRGDLIDSKYSVNPLHPALERLPFSGFQSSLIADRRGSAIWPAIETLQKANRSCGRARMATSTVNQ